MDPASPENASFNNKTKAKIMFFLPVFIRCSHQTKSRRGSGTAHTIPEPAGRRGHLEITLASPLQRQMGCLSSCHILLSFETGNQSRVSNLPSALHYQTGNLARSLKMSVTPEGGEGFEGLVNRRAFMFGHSLA